jgi:hypothetical protein
VRQHDPARERRREHAPTGRERVRCEADASGVADGVSDLARRAPGVRNLAVYTEGKIVAAFRADLRRHEDDDPLARAFPSVASRLQRVVIGQQDGVGSRHLGGDGDLVDRGRAVRVGAVYVNHAGHVDHRGHVAAASIAVDTAMGSSSPS